MKTTDQEFRKSQTNDTEINNTEFSDTNPSSNYHESGKDAPVDIVANLQQGREKMDGIDQMAAYRELIKENISYGALLHDSPYERERLDEAEV